MYNIVYTNQAQRDSKKIVQAGLKDKVEKLLDILKIDPFKSPPPFEKLLGDLSGAFSRRINIQHRLIYQVYKNEEIVKVIRMYYFYY